MSGRKTAVLAIALGVSLAIGAAEEASVTKKEKTPTPAAPPPAPEMEKLAKRLVGTWEVREKHEPSPWSAGGEGQGRETYRLGPGGHSLIGDYRSSGPLGRNFRAQGIVTWDAGEKVYKMFWVNSLLPGDLLGRGRWQGSDLVWESEYSSGEKKIREKVVVSDITPTSSTDRYYQSVDGGEMKLLMTLVHRKLGRPRRQPH